MLTCRDVTDRASLLVDGGISTRERVAVWLHLSMCENCRRFRRQLLALVVSMKPRDCGQLPTSP